MSILSFPGRRGTVKLVRVISFLAFLAFFIGSAIDIYGNTLQWGETSNSIRNNVGGDLPYSKTDGTVGAFAQLIWVGANGVADVFVPTGTGVSGDDMVVSVSFSCNSGLLDTNKFGFVVVPGFTAAQNGSNYYVRVFDHANPFYAMGVNAYVPTMGYYWQSALRAFVWDEFGPDDQWPFAGGSDQQTTIPIGGTSVAIDNAGGASGIGPSFAALNGNLISGGSTNAAWMTIYWGTNDGGTNAFSWQYPQNFGYIGVGPFSTNIGGLASNATYYYRCYASNSFGTAWAPSTTNFVTTGGDSDSDGMNDSWEILYFGNTTTANAGTDYDGDGLRDVLEFQNGSSPTVMDTDADGFNDYVEYINKTIPTNAVSTPTYPYKEWTRMWGSTSSLSADYADSVYVDATGGVYTAGQSSANPMSSMDDAKVVKYDSVGNQLWVRGIGGSPAPDNAKAVCIGPGGVVFVAGLDYFNGYPTGQGPDITFSRFDVSGNSLGTQKDWGVTNNSVGGICADSSNNAYIAGSSRGTFGSLAGQTNAGLNDICISKYNSAGTHIWSRVWGSAQDDYGRSICYDSAGYLYIAGNTMGSFDGQTNAGFADFCLIKCDTSGNKLWTRIWGGSSGSEQGYAVCVGTSNDIYVAGSSAGSFDGQTQVGASDLCLTKFDPNGNKLWTRIWGSTVDDYAYGVSALPDGTVYITGYTYGAFDGQSNYPGMKDLCLTKYDAQGNRLWTRIWGSISNDTASSVFAADSGEVYVCGKTESPFDGQTNVFTDAFLTKWIDSSVPLIRNLPATSVVDNSATLNGNLVSGGGTNTAWIRVCWGLTDGWTNVASWSYVAGPFMQGIGAISTNITSLASNTTYYYRCHASNAFGESWAPSTTNFMTSGGGSNTAHGTPYSWIDMYFGGVTNYEAADLADQDADGMVTWQEYNAGTDPANAGSILAMTGLNFGGKATNWFSWSSVSGKLYNVYCTTNLLTAYTLMTSAIAATPPVNSFSDTAGPFDMDRYYRVTVNGAVTGEVSSVNSLGFLRREVSSNRFVIMAGWCFNPVIPTNDNVSSILGGQLGQGPIPLQADKVYFSIQGTSNFMTMARNSFDGQYHDPATWTGLATNKQINTGEGFWLRHAAYMASTTIVTLAGEVVTTPTQSMNIVMGPQLICYPYSCDAFIQSMITNCAGGTTAANADQIITWDSQTMTFSVHWFRSTDRQWYKGVAVSTQTFKPGDGFWFICRSNFTWTTTCPYAP